MDFKNYPQSVPAILDQANLASRLANQPQILIKPNLTINLPPPCTTPVQLVEEIIKYCRQHQPQAKIIVAEGSGGCETPLAFRELGYDQLPEKYQVELVDLNRADRVEKTHPKAQVLKKVKLPLVIFASYLINVPVLKCHHEAVVTGAMKNLFGLYLNEKPHLVKWWNKSELHGYGVHQSIADLSLYVPKYFTLMDASVGQAESEIHGRPCDPPLGKLLAGEDFKEIDKEGARLLGIDPKRVVYLN